MEELSIREYSEPSHLLRCDFLPISTKVESVG